MVKLVEKVNKKAQLSALAFGIVSLFHTQTIDSVCSAETKRNKKIEKKRKSTVNYKNINIALAISIEQAV